MSRRRVASSVAPSRTALLRYPRGVHHVDVYSEDSARRWVALDITIPARRNPAWHVSLAPGRRVRIGIGDRALAWARVHRMWRGVTWLRAASEDVSTLAPIDAPAVRAVRAEPRSNEWFAAWAREFLRGLDASQRSPLHDGDLRLERAYAPGELSRASGFHPVVDGLDAIVRDEDAAFEPWESGGLLPMRRTPAGARVRAWRKRARDGTLPPVLLTFVSSLDMFVILDGHDRLRAAVEESVSPPMLSFSSVRRVPREMNRAFQDGIAHRASKAAESDARLAPLSVAKLNHLAIAAWENRPWLLSRTRATPLPRVAWDSEVVARLSEVGAGPEIADALLRE